MLKMFLAVAGLGVFLSQSSIIVTAKMKDQMQLRLKAKELTKKADYLQNKMDVETVLQNKQINNMDELDVNPSVKIIPSSTLSARDELLFIKLDRAIDKYFETNSPAIEPSCSNLATTLIITEDDCTEIKTKDIQTFNVADGIITYTVDSEIQRHLNALSSLRQHALDSNGSFKDEDSARYSQSKILSKWKESKSKVMRNFFIQFMDKKDYLTASNIAKKISYSNAPLSLMMGKTVVEKTVADSNLSLTEKKIILENILHVNIVANKNLKKETLAMQSSISIDDLDIDNVVKGELINYIGSSEIESLINKYMSEW